MNSAARSRPKASPWPRVKISSNWSKMTSGVSVLASLSQGNRRDGAGIPRATHPEPPSPPRPAAHALGRAKIACLICCDGAGDSTRVVDANVDGAETFLPQSRTIPASQDQVLPRPDWPKRIESAFLCTRRASSAISSSRPWKYCGLFAERVEPEPGILLVDQVERAEAEAGDSTRSRAIVLIAARFTISS